MKRFFRVGWIGAFGMQICFCVLLTAPTLALPGDPVWPTPPGVGQNVGSSPAIAAGGTIYVGGVDGKLRAFDASGTELWSHDTGGIIGSSPSIGSDGTVYVGSYDGGLDAVSASGAFQWSYTTGGPIYSSPAIAPARSISVFDRRRCTYRPSTCWRWLQARSASRLWSWISRP